METVHPFHGLVSHLDEVDRKAAQRYVEAERSPARLFLRFVALAPFDQVR
jgi:hypothetical protein